MYMEETGEEIAELAGDRMNIEHRRLSDYMENDLNKLRAMALKTDEIYWGDAKRIMRKYKDVKTSMARPSCV